MPDGGALQGLRLLAASIPLRDIRMCIKGSMHAVLLKPRSLDSGLLYPRASSSKSISFRSDGDVGAT